MRSRYKQLFNTIITPLMLMTNMFLIVAYWDLNNTQTHCCVLAIILLVIFNVIQHFLTKRIAPCAFIQTHSETLDVIRWCINLPAALYIVWCLHIQEVAIVAFFFLLLTLGAMTTVYSKKHKLITVGMACTCFCILILGIYTLEPKDKVYMIACYIGLVFSIWKMERLMFGEMTQYIIEQDERKQLEQEAEFLQRDAAIGYYTKAINHELNTLIGIANFSAYQIEANHNAHANIDEGMQRLDHSLTHMNRVSSLVLDGLGNKSAAIRIHSLQDLESDLHLLIATNHQNTQTKLAITFPENSQNYLFKERSGSTYLIIHNLVRNAYEAIDEVHLDSSVGKINIRIILEDDHFLIAVADNGIGMSQKRINDIKNQLSTTTKLNGHGLGLRFVQSECKKNGMTLDIESTINSHTIFKIMVPLVEPCSST